MPPNVVLASGAAVAVSVAVAAAIALYESPELRRYADDLRRRIAIAIDGMGNPNQNNQNHASREPVFNRPEDADGFMLSSRGDGAQPGVEADEETRKRQRDELMYWNSVMLEKQKEMEKQRGPDGEKRPEGGQRGSSFDDFMKQDKDAEKGAYVFNSGAETKPEGDGLRRRGEVNRGIAPALLANPFADEFGIGSDDFEDRVENREAPSVRENNIPDEILSDIYSATTRDAQDPPMADTVATLIDFSPSEAGLANTDPSSSVTLDQQNEPEHASDHMSASQESEEDAYASIQAWAQNAANNQSAGPTPNFYSPLPVTPVARSEAISEPSEVSDGQLTPTDSVSIIGSGEAIGEDDARSSRDGEVVLGEDGRRRVYDVMSESEGMITPASWSEVGSVVSEYEAPRPNLA